MQQDNQAQEAQFLEDIIIEDFQKVITSLTDAQVAINYFEDDPENPKILVFLNLVIQSLNQSKLNYQSINTKYSNLMAKIKLIKQHVKELCQEVKIQIKYNTIIDEYLSFFTNKLLDQQIAIEDKKQFNVSSKESTNVSELLSTLPIEKWNHDTPIIIVNLKIRIIQQLIILYLYIQRVDCCKSDEEKRKAIFGDVNALDQHSQVRTQSGGIWKTFVLQIAYCSFGQTNYHLCVSIFQFKTHIYNT